MECLLPAAFVDVSTFRQVPDHQEVFVNRDAETSFVVELLSLEPGLPEGQSARHFFDDLAQANEAPSSQCEYCEDLSARIIPNLAAFPKSALVGRQTVSKHRGGPLHDVRIFLVNVRLPRAETDLLISVNVPCEDGGPVSMAPANCEAFVENTPVVLGAEDGATMEGAQGSGAPARGVEEWDVRDFLPETLRSFNILDWSLFC
ncbi:unnamed protein product [Discosporangium mesarthrocarpum]